MKKHSLILTILLLALTAGHGQTNAYHPFPDSHAIWIGTYWYYDPSSGCVVNDDYNLYISGDTTIGTYLYHKLYKNGYMSAPPCLPPGFYYYGQYWSAFRQDSTNKKIYLFKNGTDTLAYDFNLNVGDTLPITCLSVGFNNYIQSIDSVLIGNQYHKRFWLSNNYAALIEGIGTTLGAFVPIAPPFESGNDLWCVRINNQIVWTSSQGNDCSLTSIRENYVNENQILIFPNPFSLTTTLKINGNFTNAILTMYDAYGQQVKQIKNISGQTITLHRDNLPSGLYFLRLTENNKTFAIEKLLITD